MDEIKSVRVRRNDINSGSLDIRVVIFKQNHTFGADERVVAGIYNPYKPDAKKVWMETIYKKTGAYKDYTDDQFIKDFIDMNSKIEGKSYQIIQDPWENKVPLYRNFGSDPYYLNNGAIIYIMWKDGTKDVGGQKYSDDTGHEITPTDISFKKTIKISSTNETKSFTLNKNDEFEYDGKPQEFAGYNSDKGVIASALSKWRMKIPDYNDLALCSPDNESCSIIPYKSPLQPIVPDVPATPVVPTAINAESASSKEKINIVLQTEKIKVKEDVTSLKVFIGIVKNTPLEPLIEEKTLNEEQDDFIDGEGVDYSEYVESDFQGMDEVEIQLQEDVSSGQQDSDSELVTPGTPANIRPVSNFDSLLKLAGDCARELGKNPRVNYQNLRSGYIKGVHGLCPQGTLSVLYALTGIKQIGQLRGNANSFSMNGGNSFVGTGYFNNKIRTSKADYFDNPSKWQVGDVIAVDYTGGKPYGHIQVWTGVKWMSDFSQNKLQISHVDWNSVALHRMNDKGVAAVKKQSASAIT
jgi:hypothetical protein